MANKRILLSTLVGLGLLLNNGSNAIAAETHTESTQFEPIEQPIGNKIAVTVGGMALIGLNLWWFLLSKPKPHPQSPHQIQPNDLPPV